MQNVKWKCQLETFTEVGKVPVPGAGQEVPWGPEGGAGVWRLRRGPSPLLKEEEKKLRCGGRRKQGWEVGCAAERSCLGILSVRSCVSRTVSVQAGLIGHQSWVA